MRSLPCLKKPAQVMGTQPFCPFRCLALTVNPAGIDGNSDDAIWLACFERIDGAPAGQWAATPALLLCGGWWFGQQLLLQSAWWLLKLLLNTQYQPAPDNLISEVSNAEPSQEGCPLHQTVRVFSD